VTAPVRALPIPVRPSPTDTVSSFIHRLAEANHLKPSHLLAWLRPPPEHRGQVSLDRLAAVSGRRVDALQHTLADLRCGHCDQPLAKITDMGRPARWCSPICRDTAYRKRRDAIRTSPHQRGVESVCETCGTHVVRDRTVRWCSRICRSTSLQRRRTCGRCSTPFTAAKTGRSRLGCSRRCRDAVYEDRKRARSYPLSSSQVV
jgi:hypothetical protein